MKICRIAPTYPTNLKPGMGLPEYYLAKYTAGTTLLITRWRKGYPMPPPSDTKIIRIPYFDVSLSKNTGKFRLFALFIKVMGYMTFFVLSLPFLVAYRPHVIHIHSPMPILHGLFAKYIMGSKLFITFHGTDVKHVPESWLLRKLLVLADMVCYVSNSMAQTLSGAISPERLLYTPNGVDMDMFPKGDGNRSDLVLMVGSLRWQKGYIEALNGFSLFRSKHPGWKLVIVGQGPMRNGLDHEIVKLGLGQNVVFVDTASRQQVAKWMRDCRIFMLSSVTEGFPKVILEAASSGLPMIVTDVGSCRELVEDKIADLKTTNPLFANQDIFTKSPILIKPLQSREPRSGTRTGNP